MKKLFALMFVVSLVLCLLFVPACAETVEEAVEAVEAVEAAEVVIDDAFRSGDFDCVLLVDGTAQITYYRGSVEKLDIPAEIDGYAITSIGEWAFNWCNSLTQITIPDSVTSIGKNPFWHCESLTQIKVSPDHPALAVMGGVLFSKPDKRLICYPCALMEASYEVPKGIRIIGDEAFYSCKSLTQVTIPARTGSQALQNPKE